MWAVFVAACQPWAFPPDDPACEKLRPAPGVIEIAVVGCADMVPPGGDGRASADLSIETAHYRAVLRNPQDTLTLRDIGGATLIDLAPWGASDAIHEIVPIVGGGWLDAPTITLEADAVVVTGTVVALPHLPDLVREPGAQKTITYRPDPDIAALVVEGAEGFYINPLGDESLYAGLAVTDRAVGAVGVVTDLGGAYLVEGTDRLFVGTDRSIWAVAHAAGGPEGIAVSGTAPGADALVLLTGEQVVGRVGLVDGAFATRIPATVDGVRAEKAGRAPSSVAAPATGLNLVLGAAGSIVVRPVFADGLPHWSRVAWTATDGRSGTVVLPPMGETLSLGAGVFDLTLSAGPAFHPLVVHLEVAAGAEAHTTLAPAPTFTPGPFVLAGFRRPADRGRTFRGSDVSAGLQAAADGLVYATFALQDDVSDVATDEATFPLLRFRNGVVRAGEGYSVASWPWSANTKRTAGGAPLLPPANAADDAALLWGGPDDARTLHVDLGWLAVVGPPHLVDPVPQLVALEHPGVAPWAPWFTWLDAFRPLVPTGPATWVAVTDPALVGTADVEQGLARGAVVAGNGPWLELLVNGVGPGEQVFAGGSGVTTGLAEKQVSIRVANAEGLDHLALITAGGAVIGLPVADATLAVDLDNWVVLAGWSNETDGAWAVTGPVWLNGP